MGAADAAPVDSVLGAIALGGALGDEGDALAEVEIGLLLGVDAGDLDEGGGVVLVAEAALVAEDGTAYVQSAGFGGHFGYYLVSENLTCGKSKGAQRRRKSEHIMPNRVDILLQHLE